MKKFLIACVAAALVAAAMLATPGTAQARWGYGRGHPAYGAWGYGALAAPYQYFPYASYPDYQPYPYYYRYGVGYATGCGCY